MSKKLIENRLRRLEGQVVSLRELISSETSCEIVVPQFLAVNGAFKAAFETYIKEELVECSEKDKEKRDQLIAMLIRK